MGKKDPRVDAYIAKAADFAKPILEEIRATGSTCNLHGSHRPRALVNTFDRL
jgi:hypothetical protein